MKRINRKGPGPIPLLNTPEARPGKAARFLSGAPGAAPSPVRPPRECSRELRRICRLVEGERGRRDLARRQRAFIDLQTHALRAHLHAVMGYAGLLLRKTRDILPAQQVDNLNKLLLGAEQLNEAIKRLEEFPY